MRIRGSIAVFSAAFVLLGLSVGLRAAQAQSPAVTSITPVPANTFNNGSGYSLGWEFTDVTSEVVTGLGYFDNAGLTENHAVAIYNVTGTLLTTATVSAGSAAVGDFAYVAAPNITLTAGTSYWIMGASGVVDNYTFVPSAISYDPSITFVQSGYTGGGSSDAFVSVMDHTANSYFGPTFEFGPAASSGTPEPGAYAMLGSLSLVAAGFLRRRTAKCEA